MKRRITVEQLNELTKEQKQKLRKIWTPITGDWFLNYEGDECIHDEDEINSWNHADEYCLPLLDIGQMIEIIHDYRIKALKDKLLPIEETVWNTLNVISSDVEDREMCEVLWDTMKIVLKELIKCY